MRPASRGPAARGLLPFIGMALLISGCADASRSEVPAMTDSISVTSSAFQEGGTIPSRYSCDGEDVSPPLEWSGAPTDTRAYALVVDDPDARGFVHLLVSDIPAEQTTVAEGAAAGTEGTNDFGRRGWGGPCPPSGSHRYVFTVYALSEALGLDDGFSADELRAAMEGNVIGSGEISASYSRGG